MLNNRIRFLKSISVIILTFILQSLPATAASSAKKDAPKPLSAKFKPLKGDAAQQVLTAIQDTLEKVANKTKTVKGTGTVENEFMRQKNVKDFTFQLKTPGMLRLEFTAPDDIKGTLMLTDGKTFWNHIPAMKKTYKIDLQRDSFDGRDKPLQNELGLLLALVTTPLEREAFWKKFELVPMGEDIVDGRDCYVAEFKARPAPGAKNKKNRDEGLFNQYLWIEKSTGLTWQIELLVLGAPELVKINKIELNAKMKNSLFTFKE